MHNLTFTAAELAALVGGRLEGPADIQIRGAASLDEATPECASFLGHAKYLEQARNSRAGVMLVPPDYADAARPGTALIRCPDPSAAFTKIVEKFTPPPEQYPAGIHPSAVVHPGAKIADSAHVGALAVVGDGVRVGERSVIGAGCFVGTGTVIGADCLIYPNVSIRERILIGDRVIIHCGTVVGSDGYGYMPGPDGHRKIPQVGIVQIDDDVEIGALTAIDRARFGRTHIGRGTKVDNLVQIAHNVEIGEHCLIIGQAGISGSTHLGRNVIVAGQTGLAGHLKIGDGAICMAASGVTKDLPPGAKVVGFPAVDRKEFAHSLGAPKRLAKLQEKVRELEKLVAELRGRG